MTSATAPDIVFNVVWTGDAFAHLRYFVTSLMEHSDARFRFIANACAPESKAQMQAYAGAHRDRVVEVMEVSESEMIAHGDALDAVFAQRDDGEFFCFVDADIKAGAPFLDHFRGLLTSHDAVTSGREVWTDDNVVPDSHLGIGVGGRHFYHPDGFVYGSPHLAFYRRAALDETCRRWDVGLGTAGNDLTDTASGRLAELGHLYRIYDTGKVVNILLQGDGHPLTHSEHDALIHIGGMSHYLSPPEWDQRTGANNEPTWTTWGGMEARTEVARFTAGVLRASAAGRPAPPIPPGLDPAMRSRLEQVRAEVIDLVERYGP